MCCCRFQTSTCPLVTHRISGSTESDARQNSASVELNVQYPRYRHSGTSPPPAPQSWDAAHSPFPGPTTLSQVSRLLALLTWNLPSLSSHRCPAHQRRRGSTDPASRKPSRMALGWRLPSVPHGPALPLPGSGPDCTAVTSYTSSSSRAGSGSRSAGMLSM